MKLIALSLALFSSLAAQALVRDCFSCELGCPASEAACSPDSSATPSSGYTLAVHSADKQNFFLSFSTRETFGSMCTLTVDEVTLTNKEGTPVTGRDLAIRITTHLDPNQPCLAADGPNTGAIHLSRGLELPMLVDGNYMVYINGEWMGSLTIFGDKISAQ